MEVEEKEDLTFLDTETMPTIHMVDENPRDVLFEWDTKFKEGTLSTADFKDHWKKFVPTCYAYGSGLDFIGDDKNDSSLIEILEMFIAGGDFASLVQKVQEGEKPPSICGRVFKVCFLKCHRFVFILVF